MVAQPWVSRSTPSPLMPIKIIYYLYSFNLEHNCMDNHTNNDVIVSNLIGSKKGDTKVTTKNVS